MAAYYIGSQPFGYNDLSHHGILGMKWGIRRYQNPDGTLTPEGKERYGSKYGITDHRPNHLERTIARQANFYRKRSKRYRDKAAKETLKYPVGKDGDFYVSDKAVKLMKKAEDADKFVKFQVDMLGKYSKLSKNDQLVRNGLFWVGHFMGASGAIPYAIALRGLD